MNEPYVARIAIKYSPGTNRDRLNPEESTWLNPGDELPKELSDEAVLSYRQQGLVVPKSVWVALHAAENAAEKAREAQQAAEDEMVKQMQHTAL